jgi:pilus assembly protein CpaB
MPNSLRIAVIVIVAGIGAFLLRELYVDASVAKAPPPVLERVAVAAADLPEGLLLHNSDVVWRSIARPQLASDALTDTPGSGANLKGALLRHAVSAGAMLSASDVIPADAADFLAAALKPGMRAISVAIDDVSGNAGLIQPGDYVDVLLTRQLSGAALPERTVESETVVSRIRVLAVGSALQRPKPADAAGSNAGARTVTLEVTPRTAQVISVATHLGALSLVLRSFATSDRRQPAAGEEMEPDAPPVWAGDVSHAFAASPRAPAAPGGTRTAWPQQPVVIYRGSKSGDEESTSGGAAGLPPLPPGLPTVAGSAEAAAALAATQH